MLVNSAKHAVEFSLSFPEGSWMLIGDGKQIDENGIGTGFSGGVRKVKMPKLGSMIFMND